MAYTSFIGNGTHFIGCSGRTVYVYDKDGRELARFRDLPYAYFAKISPDGRTFVIKTTEGRMAVYSLETLELIKKFRYSKIDGSQDDTFFFSPDGSELYSIERHYTSYRSALSVYDTSDYSLKKRLFAEDEFLEPNTAEFDPETDELYILFAVRGENGCVKEYFISTLDGDEPGERIYIPNDEAWDFAMYKDARDAGFTTDEKRLVTKASRYFFSDTDYSRITLKILTESYRP